MSNDAEILSKPCTLLFLQRDGEILLAMKKRGFGKDRWNGVGGKVEQGESVEAALVREAQEEIGVTPLQFRKVAVQDFRSLDDNGRFLWGNTVYTYLCTMWRGEPKETEEMAPRWFKLSDIPYEQMRQDDKLWLPLVLEGKLLRTDFSFDEQDKMLAHDVRVVATLDDEAA